MRSKPTVSLTALLGVMVMAVPLPAAAQPPSGAGRVKAAHGTASIVRAGEVTPATVGAIVYESDGLRTGADGRLAVMLKDESRLSLGPESEVWLSGFTYAPGRGALSLVVRVARGVLSYVSGRIATLMPEAVRLETPNSVIGVRGTHALVRVEAP